MGIQSQSKAMEDTMRVSNIRRYANPNAATRPHWWPSMRMTPKRRRYNARLLMEWGVIHHIWTEGGGWNPNWLVDTHKPVVVKSNGRYVESQYASFAMTDTPRVRGYKFYR